jgi:hypothetical protein
VESADGYVRPDLWRDWLRGHHVRLHRRLLDGSVSVLDPRHEPPAATAGGGAHQNTGNPHELGRRSTTSDLGVQQDSAWSYSEVVAAVGAAPRLIAPPPEPGHGSAARLRSPYRLSFGMRAE